MGNGNQAEQHDATGRAAQLRDEIEGVLDNDIDAVLDEIDDVLESNAEGFVRGFVHKGGQGASGWLDPTTLEGAITAAVAGEATWNLTRLAITRAFRALRQAPGSNVDAYLDENGQLARDVEDVLKAAWARAQRIASPEPVDHTFDEARTLHQILFLREMAKAQGIIYLYPDLFLRVAKVASSTTERLDPSQLVARMVDDWFKSHPSAELGLP